MDALRAINDQATFTEMNPAAVADLRDWLAIAGSVLLGRFTQEASPRTRTRTRRRDLVTDVTASLRRLEKDGNEDRHQRDVQRLRSRWSLKPYEIFLPSADGWIPLEDNDGSTPSNLNEYILDITQQATPGTAEATLKRIISLGKSRVDPSLASWTQNLRSAPGDASGYDTGRDALSAERAAAVRVVWFEVFRELAGFNSACHWWMLSPEFADASRPGLAQQAIEQDIQNSVVKASLASDVRAPNVWALVATLRGIQQAPDSSAARTIEKLQAHLDRNWGKPLRRCLMPLPNNPQQTLEGEVPLCHRFYWGARKGRGAECPRCVSRGGCRASRHFRRQGPIATEHRKAKDRLGKRAGISEKLKADTLEAYERIIEKHNKRPTTPEALRSALNAATPPPTRRGLTPKRRQRDSRA